MDKRTRFQKLGETWGVNGPEDVCKVGAIIDVAKRDGTTSRVKILTARPARPGYVDCTIESMDGARSTQRQARPQRDRAYSPECSDCRRLGRACKQCRFDEYDC